MPENVAEAKAAGWVVEQKAKIPGNKNLTYAELTRQGHSAFLALSRGLVSYVDVRLHATHFPYIKHIFRVRVAILHPGGDIAKKSTYAKISDKLQQLADKTAAKEIVKDHDERDGNDDSGDEEAERALHKSANSNKKNNKKGKGKGAAAAKSSVPNVTMSGVHSMLNFPQLQRMSGTFKFDDPDFEPSQLQGANLKHVSPSAFALLRQILTLDAVDMRVHGRLFKHLIYTSPQGLGGARSIASVLAANGFPIAMRPHPENERALVINIDWDLARKLPFSNNVFVLAGADLFKKYTADGNGSKAKITYNGHRDKRSFVTMARTFFNHPCNAHGRFVRFIVLDDDNKEGVDLFNVAHVHVFEPHSKGEIRQATGRALRRCGSCALPMSLNKSLQSIGWPLTLSFYEVMLTDLKNGGNSAKDQVVDILNKTSGRLQDLIDVRESTSGDGRLRDQFENLAIQNAADRELNVLLNPPLPPSGNSTDIVDFPRVAKQDVIVGAIVKTKVKGERGEDDDDEDEGQQISKLEPLPNPFAVPVNPDEHTSLADVVNDVYPFTQDNASGNKQLPSIDSDDDAGSDAEEDDGEDDDEDENGRKRKKKPKHRAPTALEQLLLHYMTDEKLSDGSSNAPLPKNINPDSFFTEAQHVLLNRFPDDVKHALGFFMNVSSKKRFNLPTFTASSKVDDLKTLAILSAGYWTGIFAYSAFGFGVIDARQSAALHGSAFSQVLFNDADHAWFLLASGGVLRLMEYGCIVENFNIKSDESFEAGGRTVFQKGRPFLSFFLPKAVWEDLKVHFDTNIDDLKEHLANPNHDALISVYSLAAKELLGRYGFDEAKDKQDAFSPRLEQAVVKGTGLISAPNDAKFQSMQFFDPMTPPPHERLAQFQALSDKLKVDIKKDYVYCVVERRKPMNMDEAQVAFQVFIVFLETILPGGAMKSFLTSDKDRTLTDRVKTLGSDTFADRISKKIRAAFKPE